MTDFSKVMAAATVVASPLLDIHSLIDVVDVMGLPLYYRQHKETAVPGGLVQYKPVGGVRSDLGCNVYHFASCSYYARWMRWLSHQTAPTPALVFVTDGSEQIVRYDLEVFPFTALDPTMMVTLMDSVTPTEYRVVPRRVNVVQDFLKGASEKTVFQSIYMAFYRIPDPVHRAAAQVAVIKNLCGMRGNALPDGLPQLIMEQLASPRAAEVRKVMRSVIHHKSVTKALEEHPNADEYELHYLWTRYQRL